MGDIPAERVVTNYNSDDQPFRTSGQRGALVANTLYDVFSRPVRLEYSATLQQKAYQTKVYDEHTGQLIRQTTDRDVAPQRVDDTTYTYDPAGNVTGVTSVSGQDQQKSTDTQCFTNDPLGRLTEAWTAKADCSAAPSAATVGGPEAYWHTYGYDKLGNRTKQTEHATSTGTADTVTDYTHPAPGGDRPHAVQQASVTGGPDNGRTSTFAYDKAGNTTKRTIGTKVQALTWDAEGHLATLTEGGKETSYTYDADGDRIIAKNGDGSSTLTLPNGDQLNVAANGAKTATRYYTHAGETVAVRNGNSIAYLINDHQGTAMTAMAVGSLALTRRKQLPFGGLRSEQSTVFGNRGFVGGTNDPTGLTHLGAREYDPVLGRFLSVDPVIDFGDPAQMNAYSYAHNSPLTKSDPTGLRPDGPVGGNSYNDERWANDRGMTAGYTKKSGKWVWKQTPKKDADSQKKYKNYQANPAHYMIDDKHARKYAADVNAQAKKAEIARAKAAAAEQRKKDGIWGNIKKGQFRAAWDNSAGSADWWKHRGVDIAIGMVASAGTALCIASVVCGGGLFMVGAGALFVAGLGAHVAVASEEEKSQGATQFLARTAKAEATGIAFGATFGRGPLGAMLFGPKQGVARAGLSSRGGSDPLFAGIGKFDVPAMGSALVRHFKQFF
ncbi:RHS repeat-associated core domain-containing protein [Streptomyces californicus]|uniref:RHS repeat-associated core domain-containing protein n=1 Tax=Streptomyces californicus TaxID=67351 RepID=UPI0036FD357A